MGTWLMDAFGLISNQLLGVESVLNWIDHPCSKLRTFAVVSSTRLYNIQQSAETDWICIQDEMHTILQLLTFQLLTSVSQAVGIITPCTVLFPIICINLMFGLNSGNTALWHIYGFNLQESM